MKERSEAKDHRQLKHRSETAREAIAEFLVDEWFPEQRVVNQPGG